MQVGYSFNVLQTQLLACDFTFCGDHHHLHVILHVHRQLSARVMRLVPWLPELVLRWLLATIATCIMSAVPPIVGAEQAQLHGAPLPSGS